MNLLHKYFFFGRVCLSFCWLGFLFLFHGQTFSVFLYHAPKGHNDWPVRIFFITKILREILIKMQRTSFNIKSLIVTHRIWIKIQRLHFYNENFIFLQCEGVHNRYDYFSMWRWVIWERDRGTEWEREKWFFNHWDE